MENNLEIDVKNARELGLSYGMYQAMRYDQNATQTKQATYTRCRVCGGVVTPPRTKYCSPVCLRQWYLKTK